MEAKSDEIRRSKRLQAEEIARHAASERIQQIAEVEEKTEITEDRKDEEREQIEIEKSKSIQSISSSAFRKKIAEIETAIENKKLEQEMLDHQLAPELEEIGGNDEPESMRESTKPRVKNGWIAVFHGIISKTQL
ncbi:hypothetical protein JTB14_019700 [Gonioctena quinquepunctata]|nr:hypothetical protein JTB14_019700 [Gonioctena quinquepunctata]